MLAWVTQIYWTANFHFTYMFNITSRNFIPNLMVYHSPHVLLLQFTCTSLPNFVLVHSFNLSKPWSTPLYAVTYAYQAHIKHPPYHHHVISLQPCQTLFFHYPGLTIIENNTPDTCLEKFCVPSIFLHLILATMSSQHHQLH